MLAMLIRKYGKVTHVSNCSEFPWILMDFASVDACQVQPNNGRGALLIIIILLQAVHWKMSQNYVKCRGCTAHLENFEEHRDLILRGPVGIPLQEVRRWHPIAAHGSIPAFHKWI